MKGWLLTHKTSRIGTSRMNIVCCCIKDIIHMLFFLTLLQCSQLMLSEPAYWTCIRVRECMHACVSVWVRERVTSVLPQIWLHLQSSLLICDIHWILHAFIFSLISTSLKQMAMKNNIKYFCIYVFTLEDEKWQYKTPKGIRMKSYFTYLFPYTFLFFIISLRERISHKC